MRDLRHYARRGRGDQNSRARRRDPRSPVAGRCERGGEAEAVDVDTDSGSAAARRGARPCALAGRSRIGRAEPSSCRGTGKQPVRARWLAFTCTFPWRVGDLKSPRVTRTAWVKVQQAGKGGACISVTGAPNVNPKCLTAKGLVQSSDSSAAGAIQVATTKRFRPESSIPWQGFTRLECVGVDGFYECSFISAVSGTATVMFRASGPTVIYTSLDCQGAYAGHPECTLP